MVKEVKGIKMLCHINKSNYHQFRMFKAASTLKKQLQIKPKPVKLHVRVEFDHQIRVVPENYVDQWSASQLNKRARMLHQHWKRPPP